MHELKKKKSNLEFYLSILQDIAVFMLHCCEKVCAPFLSYFLFVCFSDLHILDHQTNSNISQRRKWLSFSLLACVISHKPHFWKAESATPSQDFFQTG